MITTLHVPVCAVLVLIFTALSSFSQQKHQVSTYCSLFDQSTDATRMVVTEAILSLPPKGITNLVDGGEAFFYSVQCNNRDHFAVADFDRADNIKLLNDLFEKAPRSDTARLYHIMLTGKLSTSLYPGFGHLNFARGLLEVQHIQTARPVADTVMKPSFKTAAPITEAVESLRIADSRLMGCLFAPCENDQVKEQFLSGAKITIDGKVISVSEFLKRDLRTDGASSNVYYEFSIQAMKRTGNSWTVFGTVKRQGDANPTFSWENKYLDDPVSPWKLIQSTIRGIT